MIKNEFTDRQVGKKLIHAIKQVSLNTLKLRQKNLIIVYGQANRNQIFILYFFRYFLPDLEVYETSNRASWIPV